MTVTEPKADASLGQLLRDLVRDSGDLIRGEVALLRAEIRERFRRLGQALTLLVLGGAVALAAALTLLFAVNRGLTSLYALWMPAEIAVWLAPLTLTVVFGGLGFVLVKKGADILEATTWKPDETLQTLREDKEWLRRKAS